VGCTDTGSAGCGEKRVSRDAARGPKRPRSVDIFDPDQLLNVDSVSTDDVHICWTTHLRRIRSWFAGNEQKSESVLITAF
jgi:hypothetical protein